MRPVWVAFVAVLVFMLVPQSDVHAQQVPLLMEGKTTLFQRVLVRPGTPLVDQPGNSAPANAEPLPPLTLMHVYKRVDYKNREWLEVGHGSRGPTDGWIAADRAIDWDQSLILAFTSPANRERSLLFRQKETLVSLIESENVGNEARGYRSTATSGEVPDNYAVSAVEPAEDIDIKENFYLLPILQHDEAFFEDGFISKVLQVAIVNADEDADVPLGLPPAEEPEPQPVAAPEPIMPLSDLPAPDLGPEPERPDYVAPAAPVLPDIEYRPFKAGVVFVVDTTTSMEPYIERTREAVRRIHTRLANSENGENMCFGIVGFRDNVEVAPALGYVTNIHLPLSSGCSREMFESRVGDVRAATTSSKDFQEDSYAGTLTSLTDMNWSDFDGRWVILVTDAGARPSTDPLGRTGQDAAQINILAREKDIAITALHLKTPSGRGNHEKAERQYKSLSFNPISNGPLYFGVPDGDIDAFGNTLDDLAGLVASDVSKDLRTIREQDIARNEEARRTVESEYERAVSAAREQYEREQERYQAELAERERKLLSHQEAQAQREAELILAQQQQEAPTAPAPPVSVTPINELSEEEREFRNRLALQNRAMRLQYLGRAAGTKAPPLFEAWIADVALEDPAIKSVDVRVLLTRNQLGDLQEALKRIVEVAERTRTTASEFFSQLQEAAALMSRDPSQVGVAQVSKLSDLGALGEYLDGLPYRSKVLEIDEDTWLSWSFGQQREFLDELESKIENYDQFHADTDLWVSLDGGRVPGDAVYPVPLEALP